MTMTKDGEIREDHTPVVSRAEDTDSCCSKSAGNTDDLSDGLDLELAEAARKTLCRCSCRSAAR